MRIIVYENVSGSLYVRTDAWHSNATEARYHVSINIERLKYVQRNRNPACDCFDLGLHYICCQSEMGDSIRE